MQSMANWTNRATTRCLYWAHNGSVTCDVTRSMKRVTSLAKCVSKVGENE